MGAPLHRGPPHGMAERLGESQVGWQADLDLSFARRGERTVLTRNQHWGPLQVQKALYPEGKDTCHIAILHPPGGVAAGDGLNIRASLKQQARALLTTPGATKWYRSEGSCASQQVHFSLGEDAVLEWLPRESIIFDGAVSWRLDRRCVLLVHKFVGGRTTGRDGQSGVSAAGMGMLSGAGVRWN